MNHTELNARVAWQSGPKKRGGFSILWTGLALIITCTWTTLHLNVPGLYDTSKTQLLRKVKWTFIMVIFPEFVLARAIVELKTALDDDVKMAGQAEQMRRLGWCVHPSRSALWIQRVLKKLNFPLSVAQDSDVRDEEDARSCRAPVMSEGSAMNGDPTTSDRTPGTDNDITDDDLPTHDNVPRTCYRSVENLPARKQNFSFSDQTDAEAAFHPARRNCNDHKCYLWTLTHTVFANMGGLMLPLHDGCEITYTGRFLTSGTPGVAGIPRDNHFTEDDIVDKSNGDGFVRGIWLLQILRLLLDLIARAYQKYPMTPLEIITASFAALSFTTVIVQSKKPLDVRKPLDTKTEALLLSMLTGSTILFSTIHCGAWAYEFPSLVGK
ncbi:uncharacterized protein CC84DRAFT_1205847 [Paraphaeosphaeria sporulosa]|uniref:Uncharacterized protein n=1 Tax=Paraphaeosphaeria sporulosa TaxID=1460663 RepID=A0A177CHR1_9PLEO|nr:uncharacterized protein CC84DRAFT_1205847 [Paraphaeosphaeria sporulosa]OAG06317.1 hypothetical protein CC84DRAFT_1205847 [Paraphaeosphaeria sporulosa]